MPANGGVIVAGNHCSYADPVIIGVAAGRELWYLAKAEVFSVPFLGSLLVRLHSMPVDRSRGDRGALMAWAAKLESGGAVLIFPEGTRNKSGQFLKPRLGIGMLGYRARVPVVPVYLSGTVNIWKNLIGMERVTVRFGKPIRLCPEKLPERRKDAYYSISSEVMQNIEELKQGPRDTGTVAPATARCAGEK